MATKRPHKRRGKKRNSQAGKPKPRINWTDADVYEMALLADAGLSMGKVEEETGISVQRQAYRLRRLSDAAGLSKGNTLRSEWRRGRGERVQAYLRQTRQLYFAYLKREVIVRLIPLKPQ